MIDYLIYRIGIFLAFHLPLRIGYKLAIFVADLRFLVSKSDRRAVIDNLKVILNKSDKETVAIARGVFRNFAKYLVDFFRFSKIDDKFVSEYLTVKNAKYIDEALRKGKGVIVVAAHLGNWEMGGVMLSKIGYKTSVIALDHKNKLINDFFIGQRSGLGVNVISIGIALRNCFKVLKRNEVLGILGDRDFSAHGVETKFFGKKALMPKGPATFSIRAGAPIVPCFLLRNSNNTFTLVFEKEVGCQPTGDFEKDVKSLTEKIIGVLEDYIKRYPDQWHMFRRFWS